MRLFKELQDEGVTLIMVTHDNEVAAQGKRIIQVRDGKVLIDTPVERWNP
jgi:ABC-type lipoprotein export system ATPase subunit